MSARPIASATISFGLVSIPVKLFPATAPQSSGISFNLLHKKCGSRLKQQYVCPKDEEVVGREDMVKGYEYAKGQYVTFTEEELEKLESAATESIEIVEFVPLSKVDPIYFERPYYLGPDKGGEKAYHLLVEAMRRTGRAALAKYAARGKQYLVMLRPAEGGIVMQQLRYAGEVRPISEVPVGEPAPPKEAELRLATQLIEQIASDEFRPENYRDDVKDRTEALIARKVEGQEITVAPAEAPRGQIIDLLEALKQSLAEKGAAPARKPPKRAEEAPPAAAAAPAARKRARKVS